MIFDKLKIIDIFQHTLSLSIAGACTPVICMSIVLLPGQKGSTAMLQVRKDFFSFSDFSFSFRICFEYFCAFFDYVSFDIISFYNHWCPNHINFEYKAWLWLKRTIDKLEQSNYDPFVHDFWHVCSGSLPISHSIIIFFKLSINMCVTKIYSQDVCLDFAISNN